MSKVKVDFAKTKDDPDLPRAWSKYTKVNLFNFIFFYNSQREVQLIAI